MTKGCSDNNVNPRSKTILAKMSERKREQEHRFPVGRRFTEATLSHTYSSSKKEREGWEN